MTTLSNPPSPTRTYSVPNMLTYARIAAVPAVVGCMYGSDILHWGRWLHWVALVIFISAGLFVQQWSMRLWLALTVATALVLILNLALLFH